eukprot:3839610-Amphidinium_carterae.1
MSARWFSDGRKEPYFRKPVRTAASLTSGAANEIPPARVLSSLAVPVDDTGPVGSTPEILGIPNTGAQARDVTMAPPQVFKMGEHSGLITANGV